MKWQRRLLQEERGVTLVELMVGTAVAALILIAVASIELSGWRYRQADERSFAGQAEAATLVDRLAQDVRQAMSISLGSGEGGGTVTVTGPQGAIVYRYDPASGQVLRQGRVLLREATGFALYREDGGWTLRAVVTAAGGFRLESRATARLGP